MKRIVCACAFAFMAACMNDFSKFEGGTPNEGDAGIGPGTDATTGGGLDAAVPRDAAADAPACDVSRCVANNTTCRTGCEQTLNTCEAGCGSSQSCKRTCRDQRDTCNGGCRTTCMQCAAGCPANCN